MSIFRVVLLSLFFVGIAGANEQTGNAPVEAPTEEAPTQVEAPVEGNVEKSFGQGRDLKDDNNISAESRRSLNGLIYRLNLTGGDNVTLMRLSAGYSLNLGHFEPVISGSIENIDNIDEIIGAVQFTVGLDLNLFNVLSMRDIQSAFVPYFGLGLSIVHTFVEFEDDEEKDATVFFIIPALGFKYFLSDNIGLTLSVSRYFRLAGDTEVNTPDFVVASSFRFYF